MDKDRNIKDHQFQDDGFRRDTEGLARELGDLSSMLAQHKDRVHAMEDEYTPELHQKLKSGILNKVKSQQAPMRKTRALYPPQATWLAAAAVIALAVIGWQFLKPSAACAPDDFVCLLSGFSDEELESLQDILLDESSEYYQTDPSAIYDDFDLESFDWTLGDDDGWDESLEQFEEQINWDDFQQSDLFEELDWTEIDPSDIGL